MNTESRHFSSRSPREQALAWVMRLEAGDPTDADRQSFEEWLHEHPRHRLEYDRYMAVWKIVDHTSPLMASELAELDGYWENHAPAKPGLSSTALWGWSQPFLAAGMAVAAVVIVLWLWAQLPGSEQVYHTAKGEQRTITLEEGTTIAMNTDSILSVQVAGDARTVKLQQGEALFTVAHDDNRPFVVHARNGVIHDIGTRFLVHNLPKKVRVAVLEGSVEVGLHEEQEADAVSRPKILQEGDQLFYTDDARMSQIEAFTVKPAIAWIQGKLIFVDKPLAEVLNEWERYRQEAIRLSDPRLGDIPISGVFHIDNIASFFRALEEAFAIRANRHNPHLVVLERPATT